MTCPLCTCRLDWEMILAQTTESYFEPQKIPKVQSESKASIFVCTKGRLTQMLVMYFAQMELTSAWGS